MNTAFPPDTSKQYSEIFRAAADADNLAAYHDAIAGRSASVGRIGRNFIAQEIDPETGERGNGRSKDVQRTLEWLLMYDQSYAEAHAKLMTSIRDAQQAAQEAFIRIEDLLGIEQSRLDDLKSSAMRLQDGSLVFKDAQARVRTEDGSIVPDHIADGLQWSGDEPTYEEYQVRRDRVDDLERAHDEILGIERELGEIHSRNNDNDNPQSPEEMERDADRANGLRDRVSGIVSKVHSEMKPQKVEADVAIAELEKPSTQTVPEVSFVSKP